MQMSMRTQTSETKPFGPAAAAFLAAGVGVFVLGVLTVWSEVSAGFAKTLTISTEVGPLSGKVIWSAVVYVVALGVLGAVLWRRNPASRTVYVTSGVLVVLGLLLTFPPVWKLFGAG
jgi:hypothetical protein